jgi:hypothetical protein
MMAAYRGSRNVAPLLLGLEIRRRRVITFKPCPHYFRQRSLCYLVNTRLSEKARLSGRFGEGESLSFLSGIEKLPSVFQP